MDSLEVISLLQQPSYPYSNIVISYRSILKKLANQVVWHDFRQENGMANGLSKLGSQLSRTFSWCVLLSPPDVVQLQLQQDHEGLLHSKLVSWSTCNKLLHFGNQSIIFSFSNSNSILLASWQSLNCRPSSIFAMSTSSSTTTIPYKSLTLS